VSSAALRPGVARGFYPERLDARSSWADRAARALHGVVLRPGSRRRLAALGSFARRVDGLGGPLRHEPDEQLGHRARALGLQLRREGLDEELAAAAFALVREAARRTLGTPPFDVQLMAGWAMANGMLVEMATGEGKTLAATLPACTVALAGGPVHVVTANDYLVERDAEAMRPIYAALGLSVGFVTERERSWEARRAAYACDVVYGTSKSIAFDYLRDGLVRGRRRSVVSVGVANLSEEHRLADRLMLRGLCFAIVDEADSVLADDARTPLVLSGPTPGSDAPQIYRNAVSLARELEPGRDFHARVRDCAVDFTEAGRQRIERLASPLGGFWAGPRRREEWVGRALVALHLFVRDHHYLVREGRVQIIDQPTGRLAPDRSWERGLHQLIEEKEGCAITAERETLARISYQRFFRRYLRLAGMTGTAREVARELWSVYGLRTIVIPRRLPLRRLDLGVRTFSAQTSKWVAVAERAGELHRSGRPVLIGTCSVAASEELSRILAEHGLPHRVLNARQDAQEAAIVAEAGRRGRITVATNMAGRGTDIALAEGVEPLGGLHVIQTQRGEARRIDRQMFGRCARQGERGSSEACISLEDGPIRGFFPPALLRILGRAAGSDTHLGRWLGRVLSLLPQLAEEIRQTRGRRGLLALDEQLEDLLAFSAPRE
jgi:preprotein translocase subunit SecA